MKSRVLSVNSVEQIEPRLHPHPLGNWCSSRPGFDIRCRSEFSRIPGSIYRTIFEGTK